MGLMYSFTGIVHLVVLTDGLKSLIAHANHISTCMAPPPLILYGGFD